MLKIDIADASENKLLCCQHIIKIEGCLLALEDLKFMAAFLLQTPFHKGLLPSCKKSTRRSNFVGLRKEKNIKVHYEIIIIIIF